MAEKIIWVHRMDFVMLTFSEDAAKQQIQDEVGVNPDFAMEAFSDLEEDVRQPIRRGQANPFVANKDNVLGFVCEVESGRLREFS